MTRYETTEGALRPDYVWRCREPQGRMAADGHIYQERCTPRQPHESCRWVMHDEIPMRELWLDEVTGSAKPAGLVGYDTAIPFLAPGQSATVRVPTAGCGDPECCPEVNDTDQVFASLRNGASFYETTDGLPFGIDVMPAQEVQVYVGEYVVTVEHTADAAHVRVERSDG